MPDEEFSLIENVISVVRRYLDEDAPRCTEEEVAALAANASAVLGRDLPETYLRSFLLIDGFHYSALYWLASKTRSFKYGMDVEIQGLIEDNTEYWGDLGYDKLVIAYREMDVFVYDFKEKCYGVMYRSPAYPLSTRFPTLSHMLLYAADMTEMEVRHLAPSGFRFPPG